MADSKAKETKPHDAPENAGPTLDDELLAAAEKWLEEFSPEAGGSELVLAAPEPVKEKKRKGKGKSKAKAEVEAQPEELAVEPEIQTAQEEAAAEEPAFEAEVPAEEPMLEAAADEPKAIEAIEAFDDDAPELQLAGALQPIAPQQPEFLDEEKQGLMRWDEAINLEAQVESIIFAAPKPISIAEIAEVLADDDGVEPDHAMLDSIVQHLQRLYKERSGGFRLEYDKGAGYQFRTVPAAAPLMERMFSQRQRPLSRAAHETLAIIAYRQPCTRADIEFIRGVDAGSIIKNLLERDLVACVGRKEDSGRPMLFGTTAEFLRVFRVQSLNDLPPLSAFQPASEAMIDAFQKIESPDHDIEIEPIIGDPNRSRPELSAGVDADFPDAEDGFEVREDASGSTPKDTIRRAGGSYDNEGFSSERYEDTEVDLPTRDSVAPRGGEDAPRRADKHQRQGGEGTRDEDQD